MTAASAPDVHVLRAGAVEAVVTARGGALAALRVEGRDLVAPFEPQQGAPVFRGAVLAPWPNRVADGCWAWEGQDLRLAASEPLGHALHGLVNDAQWKARSTEPSAVALGTTLRPQPGYPFTLELKVGYRLEPRGLLWSLEATNTGDRPAPYGCGIHPYLVAGSGGVDEWALGLPANHYLEVDERLLPEQLRETRGTPYDFHNASPLRGVQVDHALTGLAADGDGLVRAVLRGDSEVVLEWDPRVLPWVQVHTADRPEPHLHRSGLAVEPMTCPPDALRSGVDLVVLAPGEVHRAWWRVTAP